MNKILTLFCIVFLFADASAQTIHGRISDLRSDGSLAFVSIVEAGTNNGTYSDIDGYYSLTLTDTSHTVYFNLIGFEPYSAVLSPGEHNIRMKEKDNLLNEVVIRPGENPAERIIRKAIENKETNNPERGISFTYDSYNKLAFGAEIDSTFMSDTVNLAKLDTSSREAYEFLHKQYLFFMESATTRKFMPPNKSEETIIANRVSGLKMTEFFLLGTQLQSFSFYGETVDLLGVSYMSPLADRSISKYLFILEDTTYIGQDTVFTISFQPRRKKNFDGMKGQLFINTNGFALQNVIAEPADTSTYSIRIQQQYEFAYGRKWFPKQLNSSIQFSQIVIPGIPVSGEGRSYIRNLKFDPELKKSEFTPVTLQMLPNAGNQPDTVWNKYREHELTEKETKTYVTIDSLGKEAKLDRKMKSFEALATGQINLGPVSLDLTKLFGFNEYEKFRVGCGLRTSNLLSEKFSLGAYYAYGFGDTHSKYGGDLLVHVYRKRNIWMRALYQNDVMEQGGNQLSRPPEGLSGLSNYYNLFISRMDRREKSELSINGRLIRNLTITAFANQQFIRPYRDYSFTSQANDYITLSTDDFHVAETGFQLRFAPGEKLVRTPTREMRLFGRYPVILFRYTRGIQGLQAGDFDYNRYDLNIEKTFRILNAGQLSITAIAGLVKENIPLPLLYTARGSWDKFTIATPLAFETMRTNEFRNSQFALIHLRHNFRDLLFSTKNFAPHLVIVHNMIWGKFDHPDSHNLEIKDTQNGYYESGIQFDNLIKSNLSSIGIGVFYRYGPYHLSETLDNFAFKATVGIAL